MGSRTFGRGVGALALVYGALMWFLGGWFTYVVTNWISWGSYGKFFSQANVAFGGSPWPSFVGVSAPYGVFALCAFRYVVLPILSKLGVDPDGAYTPEGKRLGRIAGALVASGAATLAFGLHYCPGGYGQAMSIVFTWVPTIGTLYTLFTAWPAKGSWPRRNQFFFALSFCMLLYFGYQMVSLRTALTTSTASHAAGDNTLWIYLIAWTCISWGLYVPLIHRASAKMLGKNKVCQSIRAITMVGECYVALGIIAVLVIYFGIGGVEMTFTMKGAQDSFIAGTLGVLGAISIVLAVNFLGKNGPLVVPSLAFSGTPAVNTALFIWGVWAKNGGVLPPEFPLNDLLFALPVGMMAVVMCLWNKPIVVPKLTVAAH